jgi:endonuclease/exonuclease/phosphatase (EEP) superfamily protein YafD
MSKLFNELLLVFGIFSALNLLPTKFWLQEVNRNLGVYYLLMHFCILIFFIIFKRLQSKQGRISLLIHSLMPFWYIWQVLPYYFVSNTTNASIVSENAYRLLYANVETGNREYQKFINIINTQNPEIVCLVEMNDVWDSELNLTHEYPFSHKILRNDNFGLAIYSKLPIKADSVSDFGPDIVPAISLELSTKDSKTIRLIVLHAIPPISADAYYNNKLLFRRISTQLKFEEQPVIVVGDFNATTFSSFYKNMLKWANLSDAMWGKGLIRTWNAKNPFLRFTIDHVLYSSHIVRKNAEVMTPFGSDHLPLMFDFHL